MSLQKNKEAQDAIAFAEKFITLLNEGAYTTTYKFAVLLGLMDLAVECANVKGNLVNTITTKQLAAKVVEIYWNQVGEYDLLKGVALQGRAGQAEIIRDIYTFRNMTGFSTLFKAKAKYEKDYIRLLNKVEKKVIEMPLARVQYFGKQENCFIYNIAWSKNKPQDLRQVTAYQNNKASEFDNSIHLLPNVADYLVNLNGLLRPMVQRMWAMEVARINKLEESKLERFLFGSQRAAIAQFSDPLSELQNNKCFYCESKFGTSPNQKPEVDHFIPRARIPNDGLANFVLAHSDCNNSKSDHIAALEHLEHWKERNHDRKILSELESLATNFNWEIRREESIGIAQTLYSRLKPGVGLWSQKGEFNVFKL